MGEVIVITSGKGGVGKTTVTANLGATLSKVGKKVCVVDTDMGLRNLDLALGMEHRIVYDAIDVVSGICTLEQATVAVDGFCSLDLIPAPQSRNCDYITADFMCRLCDMLRDKYDFILLDSPAGIDRGFHNAIAAADMAIVVTQPYVASVRDADRAVDYIEKSSVGKVRIVINSMIPDAVSDGVLMNVDNILELVGVELLGIIPYDSELVRLSVFGKTVAENSDLPSAVAYSNIAKRILGEIVPIMDMAPKKSFWKRLRTAFK